MSSFTPGARSPKNWRIACSFHDLAFQDGITLPACQVRVKSLRKCAPIKEPLWTHIPSVKHRKPGGPLHYELWLNKSQAHEIIKLFLSRG